MIPHKEGELEKLEMFWHQNNVDVTAPPLLVYADLLAQGSKRKLETAQIIFNEHIQPNLKKLAIPHFKEVFEIIDAIKQHLIPPEITPQQATIIYASEADVLNVALFGKTAKQWREENPGMKGNIRDYAHINELICLSNLENINAMLINEGFTQSDRLIKLNQIVIRQMTFLQNIENRNLLK